MNSMINEFLSVLVIDDDEFMLEIITTSLKQIGITEISTALNGMEGLQCLDSQNIPHSCVICDLQMPEMDGIELLRHLTERQYKGGVILMSGEDKRVLTTVGNLANTHHLNILGCLSKPITKHDLLSHLSRIENNVQSKTENPDWSLSSAELENALFTDQIQPYFQPQVSTRDRKIIAVEALARWHHGDGILIPPAVFIPIAEQSGLIELLTEKIYTQAIRQTVKWHKSGLDLNVAVNLSMDCLSNLEIPNLLQKIARNEGLSTDRVVLEVTESRLSADQSITVEILTRLRLMGFALSIDDFGTGYSSMELLNNIPFNELKLDRQFVHGSHRNDSSRAILESSIELARKLGMQVVAEGVEDQEDWDLMVKLGCDLVQGYYISKPQSAGGLSAALVSM